MSAEWHELDDGYYSIAGWEAIGGEWHDVEKGGTPLEDSAFDYDDLERLTFHYMDDSGNDVYFTVYGPWEGEEGIEDIIADALDYYGVTAT